MGDIVTYRVEAPYLAIHSALLEGPAYDARQDLLRWVDLGLDKIYQIKLSEGPESLQQFDLDGNTAGTLFTIKGSEDLILVGAKYGFATFDLGSGKLSHLRDYFEEGDMSDAERRNFRANDGAIDARGRIFQGIMIDDRVTEVSNVGMLISLDLDGKITRLVDGATTPNGLGWNKANTIMYWVDSRANSIFTFDYDIETGAANNRRVFFTLEPTAVNVNVPDGLVVDEQDHIWLAVWGGSCVLRISPQGLVVAKIELPTRFVTCPVFAGKDLFITSAAEKDSENYPESARFGGDLFRCHVGVAGLPKNESQPLAAYGLL